VENGLGQALDLLNEGRGYFFLPKHYAGPDGFYLTPRILIIIGCRTTQQGINLPNRSISSNYDTTDLRNLFKSQPSAKLLKEKEKIWDFLASEECTVKVIIRLHFALPSAVEGTFCEWKLGKAREEIEEEITMEWKSSSSQGKAQKKQKQ